MQTSELKNTTSVLALMRNRLATLGVAIITGAASVMPAFATIDNTVTVSGTAPGGTAGAVQDTATENVDVEDDNAELTIAKSASITSDSDLDGLGDAGDVITYTYTITNSGNTTVTGVGVTDTHDGVNALGTPTFTSWTNQNGSPSATVGASTIDMLPGAIAVFQVTYTIDAGDISAAGGTGVGPTVDGDIDNSAVASGTYPDGSGTPPDVTSTPSTAEVALDITPSLDVQKVAYIGGVPASLGGSGTATNGTTDNLAESTIVTYVYTVTNDGNVPITTIGLADSHGGLNPAGLSAIVFNSFDAGNAGSLNDDSIDGNPNQVDRLDPGDIAYFTATYTVHQLDIDQNQ